MMTFRLPLAIALSCALLCTIAPFSRAPAANSTPAVRGGAHFEVRASGASTKEHWAV